MPKKTNLPAPENEPVLNAKEAPLVPEAPLPRPVLESEKKEATEVLTVPAEVSIHKDEALIKPNVLAPAQNLPRVAAIPKPEKLVQVEKILAEDLEELYLKLPPAKKEEFKAEGEQTAFKIWQILESAKIQVKKIVDLIVRWLRIIPSVNRYFLLQEAKIKTDKIIDLAKKHIPSKTL